MRYCCLIALLSGLAALCSCSDDNVPDSIEPRLYTLGATDVTRNEATLSGKVELRGGTEMPLLYFAYGKTDGKECKSENLEDSAGMVSLRLYGLEAGTTYYYCLQGGNGTAVVSSGTASFATQPDNKPTVGPLTVLSQGPTSVIASYSITDDGGDGVTATGCYVVECYGSSPADTIQGQPQDTDGVYRVHVDGLKQNTSYTITPFAANGVGETCGEPLAITTANVVALEKAGQLEALVGDDKYSFTELSFSGDMNGSDLDCLRQMAGRDFYGQATPGKLETIDLADVRIVEGGSYLESRQAENDVVGYGLFSGLEGLRSVTLPNSATRMEQDVFAGCISLERIEVPAAMTSVIPSKGCTSLSEIDVSPANTHYSGKDGVLFNADGSEIVWFPIGKSGDYVLPQTVVSIGDYAFQECGITRFTLPDGIESIGKAVFFDSKVEEVDMPDKLRLVPTATFQNCSRLAVVKLGSATELVSDYVFDGCPLEHLYVAAKYPPVCNGNAFTSHDTDFTKTCILHVPKGCKAWYKNDPDWGLFKNIVEY